MADNTTLPGDGETLRTKDRGSAKTDIVAFDINASGSEVLSSGDATYGLDVDVGPATATAIAAGTSSAIAVASAGRLSSFSACETTGTGSAKLRLRDGSGGTVLAIVTLAAGESVRDQWAHGISYSTNLYLERVSGNTELTVATR